MNNIMTPVEFKERWDGDESGGGITFDDIADCAKAWGLCSNPKCMRIDIVANKVTQYAQCNDIYPLEGE